MEPKFMISEVLATSWKCLKSQIWVLSGLLIGYSILSFTLSVFAMPIQESWTVKMLALLVTAFIQLLFSLGYVKNMLQTLEGDEPQFSAYGQQVHKLFTFFVSSLLVGLLGFVGLCLFIIPGVYLYLRLQFYVQFIVEEDAGIVDALTRSWELTKGQSMRLLGLGLVMLAILLLGFILFVVGIYVAIPLIQMMQCYAYRKLTLPMYTE